MRQLATDTSAPRVSERGRWSAYFMMTQPPLVFSLIAPRVPEAACGARRPCGDACAAMNARQWSCSFRHKSLLFLPVSHFSPPPNIPSSSRRLTSPHRTTLSDGDAVQRCQRKRRLRPADKLHRGRGMGSLGERDPRPAGVAPSARVERVGGGLRRPANTG
jgi:hypothetical protein